MWLIYDFFQFHRISWALSSIFLGAYAILQLLNTKLIVQLQLFGSLSFFAGARWQRVSILSIYLGSFLLERLFLRQSSPWILRLSCSPRWLTVLNVLWQEIHSSGFRWPRGWINSGLVDGGWRSTTSRRQQTQRSMNSLYRRHSLPGPGHLLSWTFRWPFCIKGLSQYWHINFFSSSTTFELGDFPAVPSRPEATRQHVLVCSWLDVLNERWSSNGKRWRTETIPYENSYYGDQD